MKSEIYWVLIEINDSNIENNWLKLRSDITIFKDRVFKLLLKSKKKKKKKKKNYKKKKK